MSADPPAPPSPAAARGRGPWTRRLPQILEALQALGRARGVDGLWTAG